MQKPWRLQLHLHFLCAVHHPSNTKTLARMSIHANQRGSVVDRLEKPPPEVPEDNVFREIIRREESATIVYEDEELLAFRDISPAAPCHIQLIPKIDPVPRDVRSLTADHIPLIKRMKQVGEQILQSKGYTQQEGLLGFHDPPSGMHQEEAKIILQSLSSR